MNMPDVRVEGGPHSKDLRVWIDGKLMDSVREINIHAVVSDVVEVTLVFFATINKNPNQP